MTAVKVCRGDWCDSRYRALALNVAVIAVAFACCPARAAAQAQDPPARQVTLFGIEAIPNSTEIDPKLKKVESQLRRLLPNHGFKLLGTKSQRIEEGGSLTCDLGADFVAGAELVSALDQDGKIRLRVALEVQGQNEFSTLVKTPRNQLFFLDKTLPNGSRLLIGVGAR